MATSYYQSTHTGQEIDSHVDIDTAGTKHTPAQVGLDNVDNTSDADKPVSVAQQAALDLKLDTTETTTTPAANKIPIAGADGKIDWGWLPGSALNLIGSPGAAGFGVGIAPPEDLPEGMIGLSGYAEPTNQNYGNYQFSDGSVMVWVPRFYYRVGHADNPTYADYGVNSIDIKNSRDFPTRFDAEAAGYALHRAFIDGGVEQDGFFVDKYMASKNALGSGFVASAIPGGLPLSTSADHNPIAELTACGANAYYEAVNACKARDGVDGAINPSSQFFCGSRFIYGALAMLSLAHGQAATGTTNCAWYDAAGVSNFPKGCNNNALGDINDGAVSYTSDGYSNCGKTGSGAPFAKTTHNGQACGVADLNGLMYEISLGVTCVAASKAITAATQGNPCQLTVVGHGRTTGDPVMITSVGGMTELNDKIYTLTVIDADTITLDGVDSSGFTAYTSGGTATVGDFYAAKESTATKDFTSGNTLATDHWGATGAGAMMEPFSPVFQTTYPSNGFAQRFGNGASQVLSADQSGGGWILAGLGLPKDTNGASTSGTNLFGADYFYQYVRNELCLLSCASWGVGSGAGVSAVYWFLYRSYSSVSVGFRAACYPAN